MLILLPGLICDASIYAPQLAAFPQAKAIDGYGLADTLEGMARQVLDQAPERFDLFGHSMGGRVALEVFRLAPERVRRLALCSTGIHPSKAGERDNRYALRQIGYDRGFEALVDTWLPPMVAKGRLGEEELMAPMRAMCVNAGQDVFDAQIEALLGRPEVDDLLPQIACPTLVMTGDQDSWSPPAQHQEIAAVLPNSELVIVEGSGHMILLEKPDAVNKAIAHWLDQPADD